MQARLYCLSEAFDEKSVAVGEFGDIARSAKQCLVELGSGKVLMNKCRPRDIWELKSLLSRTPCAAAISDSSPQAHLANRGRLWQGVHDRGEMFIFCDAPLENGDLERMQEHFPARVQVISIADLYLGAGDVLDVTTRPDDWDVGSREELYTVLNVGRCVIERGARLQIQGNVLSAVFQELHLPDEHHEEINQDSCHIAILPTPFPVDSSMTGPLNGPAGSDGQVGLGGVDGENCIVGGSVLGPVLHKSPPLAQRNGGRGADGDSGQRGRKGRTGGMCKRAQITVRQFREGSSPLRLYAKAGDGGSGGSGGAGGMGGNGGAAGLGAPQLHRSAAHASAGIGGLGGDGGEGGNGGRGGISSSIHVSCPNSQQHLVGVCSDRGFGGNGGMGGEPGSGGRSGWSPGSVGAPNSTPYGVPGRSGKSGRDRNAPIFYLNGTEILKHT